MKKTTKITNRCTTMSCVNTTTGEVIQSTETNLGLRDFGYHKTWLSNLADHVLKTGNKQTQIIFYILSSMDKENIFSKTQVEVAEDIGTNVKTVRECIKTLLAYSKDEPPFMVRIDRSKYRVNPDIIYSGTYEKRKDISNSFYRELRRSKKRSR